MEGQLGSNSMGPPHTSSIFNSGDVGPLYSSAPEFSPDIHVSSIPPHEMHSISTSFFSQPSNDVLQFLSTNLPYSGACQPSVGLVPEENSEMNWCPDSRQSTLIYPDNIAAGNHQIESTCNVNSDDLKHEEWSDLPDIMVDGLDDSWQELLNSTNTTELLPQRQRNLQLQLEEQGRRLQMMLEQQCKAGGERLKASPTLSDVYTQSSDPKITERVHSEPRIASTTSELEVRSQQVDSMQKMMLETEPHADARQLEILLKTIFG